MYVLLFLFLLMPVIVQAEYLGDLSDNELNPLFDLQRHRALWQP
jgi:hypothetical protein